MDVLATLQECSFRGVSFPIVSIKEGFSHDTPQHKSVDRDGAFVENTGRNPFGFAIVAPFYAQTLSRGKNETWDDLYPSRFEALRTACMDRTTGDFVHPLYGTFKVKVTEWESTLNADERGGQVVALSLVETRDDGVDPAFVASTRSRARSTAIDLDSQLATLSPSPQTFTSSDTESSFSGVVDSLTNVMSTSQLHASQSLAKLDRTIARLDKVASTLDRAASVLSTNQSTGITTTLGLLGPGSARIWTNCQVLKACLIDIRRTITTNSTRTTSVFIVDRPVMLPTLAARLSTTGVELEALNPGMRRDRMRIMQGTAVKYYKKG